MPASFGALVPAPTSSGAQTVAPSEHTAALAYMRRLQESERHRTLLNYYSFYHGTHWSFVRDFAEPLLTINYARRFVDTKVSFLFGNGVSFQTDDGEDQSQEVQLLNKIWESNDKEKTLLKMGTIGHISGDAFIKLTYIPELDQVAIIPLDSQTCFPIYSPFDPERFVSFKIEYIVPTGAAGDYNDIHLYTELYTDDKIQIAWDGDVKQEFPNPFGFIPIVQVRHAFDPQGFYGISDLKELLPLNRTLNEQVTKFQDIINYHAEPVTVIYGAKASQLTKGARKVWSGLPKDAKVENIALEADLTELREFMAQLKKYMHEISGIPENALGQEQAISNTSNAALQTQYLPLINVTNVSQINYGSGIRLICKYALRIWKIIHPTATIDTEAYVDLQWESPLPKDLERVVNEIIVPLKQIGLISDHAALKMLGSKDPEKELAQIEADMKRRAAVDGEVGKLNGSIPPPEPGGGANAAAQNPAPKTDAAKEHQDVPGGESS